MQGVDLGSLLYAAYDEFVSETGIEMIDDLLTSGGLMSMMYSISLTIIAMMFGGIMDRTGQLEVIVNTILKGVKSVGTLVAVTIGTGIFSNATMPEQYISIVVPGKMYAEAYKEKGIHPKVLSNALESGGTVTSALIPWNTCGVFMYSVLGVTATQYGRFTFFNILTPIIVIIFAYLNFKTPKIEEDPNTVLSAD